MLIIYSGRRRLRDRHIQWKEKYGDKSKNVKRKFDKILPGSYFRWEGLDRESGHPYYVVVGPSVSKKYGKSFFAGVKKLPKNPRKKAYSPSGKYFHNLKSALAHANSMWGTPFPMEAGNYNKNDISNIDIPKHIKG
jgi:hypothetical protein